MNVEAPRGKTVVVQATDIRKRWGILFPDEELLHLSTLRKIEEAVVSHQTAHMKKAT